MATSSYIGIDVSKDRLDIAVLGEKQEKQLDNTSQGIAQLVEWMKELQSEFIVVEATGGSPMNYDTGKKRGYRQTKGGRASVRSVLYMSTLVATRYNPVIQAQYQHLLKRGKEKKVALTACTPALASGARVRKFLTILNAMLRDQQPFRA